MEDWRKNTFPIRFFEVKNMKKLIFVGTDQLFVAFKNRAFKKTKIEITSGGVTQLSVPLAEERSKRVQYLSTL